MTPTFAGMGVFINSKSLRVPDSVRRLVMSEFDRVPFVIGWPLTVTAISCVMYVNRRLSMASSGTSRAVHVMTYGLETDTVPPALGRVSSTVGSSDAEG